MPDLERLDFQRSIDLVDYARAAGGYRPLPRDSTATLAVLEHPHTLDRIAVARFKDGVWVYARLDGYTPRGADEPAERAEARVRTCIERARDKGTIAQFVQSTQRVLGRDEVSAERVREHLRAWQEAQRALESPGRSRAAPSRSEPTANPEAHVRRRLDNWFPSPSAAPASAPGVRERQPTATQRLERSPQDASRALHLHQARTDWEKHLSAEHARALGLPVRGRGPERGR
jgi:hypothetical protein